MHHSQHLVRTETAWLTRSLLSGPAQLYCHTALDLHWTGLCQPLCKCFVFPVNTKIPKRHFKIYLLWRLFWKILLLGTKNSVLGRTEAKTKRKLCVFKLKQVHVDVLLVFFRSEAVFHGLGRLVPVKINLKAAADDIFNNSLIQTCVSFSCFNMTEPAPSLVWKNVTAHPTPLGWTGAPTASHAHTFYC